MLRKAALRIALAAVTIGSLSAITVYSRSEASGVSTASSPAIGERPAANAGSSAEERDEDDVAFLSVASLADAPAERPVAAVGLETVFHRYGETATTWRNMREFLGYVTFTVDLYWNAVFAASGLPDPFAKLLTPGTGESFTSACSRADGTPERTNDRSAFYCGADDTIYISQQLAYDLWTGATSGLLGQKLSPASRDFAVAYVVAHEFGHNIQRELGLRASVMGTPAFEQQADCFAGAWAAAAAAWHLLDAGDLQEALAAAWLFGDAGDDHGTSAQRQAAFSLGYQGGASACAAYSNR